VSDWDLDVESLNHQ